MDTFLKLVRRVNYDNRTDEENKNETPLTDLIPMMENLLKEISIDDVHISNCICGCAGQTGFWRVIGYGNIRLDVFQWLINKYLDLDDVNVCKKILESFCEVLSMSGVINTPDMPERVHETTMFLFDLIQNTPTMLELCKTFQTEMYGSSLIHGAFYGHDADRRRQYINMLLDMGVQLMITRPWEDDTLTEAIKKVGLKEAGQSPLWHACIQGEPEILSRMLTMENAEEHLNSYHDIHHDFWTKNVTFAPLLMNVLHFMNEWKSEKYIRESAECIKLILNDKRTNLNLLSINSENNCQHNITDFLMYYEFFYQGSPIQEIFEGVELPECVDPSFSNFSKKDRYRHYNSRQTPTPYQELFAKYVFTKDPTKFPILLEELEKLHKSGVIFGGLDDPNTWHAVPYIQDFIKKVEAHGRDYKIKAYMWNHTVPRGGDNDS